MSIKNYLATKASVAVLDNTLKGVDAAVKLAAVATLGDTKASEFAGEVVALVSDKEFLTQLSDDIGQPTEQESEDQFIARAKNTMKALLKSKLN